VIDRRARALVAGVLGAVLVGGVVVALQRDGGDEASDRPAATTTSTPAGTDPERPTTTAASGTSPEAPPGGTETPDDVAVGYGAGADGGAGGAVRMVTDLAASGPGTLRAALEPGGPAVVRFAVSGTISLGGTLDVPSHTTIDGAGASIVLDGTVRLAGVEDVVIRDLTFVDSEPDSNDDLLALQAGTRTVWIDHCAFGAGGDGALDITQGATDITVSWSTFREHDKVMLVNTDQPPGTPVRVTVHHNLFDDTGQRHPLVGYATVHAFNNYLRGWDHYGMQVHAGGQLVSEANVFEADGEPRALIGPSGDDRTLRAGGGIRSIDDLFLGGAAAEDLDHAGMFDPHADHAVDVEPATVELADRIEQGAGPR
jgi:pectate lyase